jgi:PAS domain S-box-containing protein
MALRGHPLLASLVIGLTLVLAFLVDQSVAPREHFVSSPFAIPLLIAAFLFSIRGGVVTFVFTIGLAVYAAYLDRAPFVPALFHLAGLTIIGVLAIALGDVWRRSAQRAREAEDARQQVSSILNSITDAFCALDRSWRFTYLNDEAVRLFREVFRLVPEELLGKNVWEVFPEATGSPFEPNLRRAMTERVTVTFDAFYSPSQRWFDVRAYPSQDGLSVFFRDVTERRRTEEALSQQAQIIDQIHDAVVSTDLNGYVTSWNKGAERLFGYTAAEAIGKHISFVYPDGVYPEGRRVFLDRQVIAPLRQKGHHEIEVTMQRKSGELFVADLLLSLLRNRGGVVTGMIGYSMDITARKRAEAERAALLASERKARSEAETERARLQTILESAANAIIYVDAATGSLTANPEATRLFGHPFVPEAGQAQYVHQLFHSDGRPVTLDEIPAQRALSGQTIRQEELVVVQPDGRRVPVLESAAPVRGPEGRVIGAVTVLENISILKELERMRDEWTSVIAHDLRQPVTTISGYAGLLERKIQAPAQIEERRAVEHILTAARNLGKMIGDLLDVTRIEARRLQLSLQSVDLAALLPSVVERAATVTEGHPVRVEVKGEIPTVEADPGRIEQVLMNLLSNAAKYGYPATEILVTVTKRAQDVEVSVTNQGPGIAPEEMPKLFGRFYRAPEARAGRVAGLGLGLYIAKGLVEAHGGHIWAESIPGHTTTFSFTLPLSRGEG